VFAQAGPPPNPVRLPIADRNIDIIGSGSLNDLTPDREHWADVLGVSDAGTIKLFERITEEVIDGDADIRNRPANAPFLMMLVQRRPMAGVRRCG